MDIKKLISFYYFIWTKTLLTKTWYSTSKTSTIKVGNTETLFYYSIYTLRKRLPNFEGQSDTLGREVNKTLLNLPQKVGFIGKNRCISGKWFMYCQSSSVSLLHCFFRYGHSPINKEDKLVRR